MMRVAADQNGQVKWNGFLDQFQTIEGEDTVESYKEEAFRRVAKVGGGTENEIDGECLRSFFQALGENVNDEEIAELMQIADGSGKGIITLDDFMIMLDEEN
eukprot:TRINITY_DN10394_c0_g1_i1.p1 TRINITY_DN10394_c0_g1~~TRINITY_DN10394_c0_g1_i1.p1  ORF type:complete len:102 (-),score=23.76 TRINITY_DN10394_c0_g1_i1:71-376(-)